MAARSGKAVQATTRAATGRGRAIAYWVTAVLALFGLADATFLTIMHLTGDDSICGPSSGCSTVLGSVYASIHGMPTAAFGVVAYFIVFSTAICAAFGYRRAAGLLALTVTVMFLVTLWFLYLQAFVIHAYCPFCLLSAALTFVLAGITVATYPGH
jgi:uncharacterized membrane protein